jgi:ectoine hydroxylase-related dioxygenase (phytanoyl-CoA dioxygenase family)
VNAITLDFPLISNGYPLSMQPDRIGRLTPSASNRSNNELWQQLRAQGYLWLKGFLNPHEVLDFRRWFFTAFEKAGLLAAGSDPVKGIYSGKEDKEAVRKLLTESVRWASYEAFCLSRPLWEFFEAGLGGPVILHKRKIMRYTKPGDANCTGAHYDLTYLRAGTDRVFTCWIPIGDIPVEMGGLVYLEGSDAWGRRMEAEYALLNAQLSPEDRINAYNRNMAEAGWITKELPSLAERLNSRWLIADYEAGDIVIHSAYMIHAATENRDPRCCIRLSTDIRYQSSSDLIDVRWNNDWSPGDKL